MKCRLSLAWGVPPSEVDQIDSDDWHRMVRYFNTEPFGYPREEQRNAELIASVHRASTKTWTDKRVNTSKYWLYRPPKPIDYDEIAADWGSLNGMRTKKRGD